MRALVHDPDSAQLLRMAEVPRPSPRPDEALIEVRAAGLNFGELAYAERHAAGDPMGWDAAGVILEPAADGSGPRRGSRVASFGPPGGWAEQRAVGTTELAVVPADVDLAAASALPAAGVTALRAVRRLGSILGRRVLITGASGGVGRYAVQLAALAGAHVIAAVGSPVRGEGLRDLGAAEVVTSLDDLDAPVDGALDNVGGSLLAEAYARLTDGGVVLSVGMASLQPTTIDFEAERLRGGRRAIEVFVVGGDFSADLGHLLSLLAAGRLDPQVGWQGSWTRAAEAVEALRARRVAGKAVLEID